jgi:hypothetical protein
VIFSGRGDRAFGVRGSSIQSNHLGNSLRADAFFSILCEGKSMAQGKKKRALGKLMLAAAAGLAGMAEQAHADLRIDVRAIAASAGTVTGGGKSVALVSVGDTITLGVFGQISGTNGANDELLQLASGSITSGVVGLKGNLSGGVVAPFNGGSSQNGSVADIDSDGDLDVGSIGTTITGKFLARSDTLTAGTSNLDAQSEEVKIGQFTFTYTGGSASAFINFVPRTGTSAAATWFEDGEENTSSHNPSNGVFTAGTPVQVSVVPEPGTLTVAALAGLALLARRRN